MLNTLLTRRWLAFHLLLLCTLHSPAQTTNEDEWTRKYEAALKKCESSASCLELEALKLFPVAASEDCGTTMQRAALLLFNRSPEDSQRLAGIIDLAGCDTSFSQLRYNMGMLEWRKGNLNEAERHFMLGAELVQENRKAVWVTAAGAVAYEDERMEVAMKRFIEAYQLDSLNAAPMLLNNLSALSLYLGQTQDCALWGERALSRYAEFENDVDAGVGPEFSQYVHFNLFVAYTTLQNVEEATSHWERLDFKNLNAYPIQLAELLSMFARLTDQPALLDIYGEPLRKRIIGFQESGRLGNITYMEEPLASLFTREAKPFVDSIGLREAWTRLRPHIPLRSAAAGESTETAEAPPTSRWWLIALWTFILIGLVFAVLVTRLRASKATSIPSSSWFQLMNSLSDEPMDEMERRHLHLVLREIQHEGNRFERPIHSPNLNESEQVALRDGILGVFPKTTARNHNWTPTYVYILRSSVRSKLGIAPEVSFARWKERNPELAERALQNATAAKSKAE